MVFPSASRMERASKCAAAEALPATEDDSTPAAGKGKALHRYLENLALGMPREEALTKVPAEYQAMAEAIDTPALPLDPHCYRPELFLGWDPATDVAMVIPDDLPADMRRALFRARLDVAALAEDDKGGALWDYKTGRGYVPPPKENWQIKSEALLMAKVYGLTWVRAQLVFLGEDGAIRTSTAVFEQADLAQIEVQVRAILDRIERERARIAIGEAPRVVMGAAWCRWCPAFSSCPGQTSLVKVLASKPEAVQAEVMALLTPENAGIAHRKLQVVEALVDKLRASVDAAAKEFGGVLLPDGKVYGPVEKSIESVVGSKAADVLEHLFGPEVADAAIKTTTTKTAIDDALRLHKGDRTLKAMKEEAYDALRQAGAIETTVRTEMRERRAD